MQKPCRSARSYALRMLLPAAGLSLVALLGGCVPIAPGPPGVIVRAGPPAPRIELVAPRPYAGAIWIPGHWVWVGRWQWYGGYWARPPHPRALWIPGFWEHRGSGWFYHRGYWRR